MPSLLSKTAATALRIEQITPEKLGGFVWSTTHKDFRSGKGEPKSVMAWAKHGGGLVSTEGVIGIDHPDYQALMEQAEFALNSINEDRIRAVTSKILTDNGYGKIHPQTRAHSLSSFKEARFACCAKLEAAFFAKSIGEINKAENVFFGGEG